MVYQMLCLNVAINSYDNALLSLLMSNQFVEIKGSVFKKFEKDNLFQITCAGPLIQLREFTAILIIVCRYRGALLSRAYALFRCLSKFNRALWVRIRFQWRDVSSEVVWLDGW
jgi:Eukaryotic membrane protein family